MAENIVEAAVKAAADRLSWINGRVAELDAQVAECRTEKAAHLAEKADLERLVKMNAPRKPRGAAAGAAPAAVAAAVPADAVTPSTEA